MRFIFAVWALLLACYLLMHPCVCREEEDEESSESVLGESEVSGSSKSSRLSLNTCSRVSQSFGNIYSIGMNEEHKMKEVYSNFADAVDEVLEDTTKKEEEQLAYFYHIKPVPSEMQKWVLARVKPSNKGYTGTNSMIPWSYSEALYLKL